MSEIVAQCAPVKFASGKEGRDIFRGMHDETDRLHLSSFPLSAHLSTATSPPVSVCGCFVDVLSSCFCCGAPLCVLTYTLITQTARNTCLE